MLGERGIGFVDAGVSGGVWGLDNGYALMVGGDAENVAKVQPAFDALKPEGESGFVHAGAVGAGHFAKMVHNGIEYGLMQAYAEGYELLEAAAVVDDVPGRHQVLDAGHRRSGPGCWTCWCWPSRRTRSSPRSAGYVDDSGEGRWTIEEAINHAVPAPVMTAALFARFASRQDDSPAMKAVAALRNQFGGHAVTKVAKGEVEKPA